MSTHTRTQPTTSALLARLLGPWRSRYASKLAGEGVARDLIRERAPKVDPDRVLAHLGTEGTLVAEVDRFDPAVIYLRRADSPRVVVVHGAEMSLCWGESETGNAVAAT